MLEFFARVRVGGRAKLRWGWSGKSGREKA
jgi:hypothetical protein